MIDGLFKTPTTRSGKILWWMRLKAFSLSTSERRFRRNQEWRRLFNQAVQDRVRTAFENMEMHQQIVRMRVERIRLRKALQECLRIANESKDDFDVNQGEYLEGVGAAAANALREDAAWSGT